MQPERIEKVKVILAAVLARPQENREDYLNSACSGDPDLRREVEHYLSRGDKTDQFLGEAKTVQFMGVSDENLSSLTTVEIPGDRLIGKEFGRYVVQSRLAEGGMGIVYLALDTQLGRDVALKVLPQYFSMDLERVIRFRREARATSLLNHPNIVTVFEVGQLDGCEFIVTEFVEGRTLRDLIRQGPIPLVEMLKIASQVAGALEAAHKAGIIHRDIKPENVMLRPDGYVKVLDFGLAKLTDTARRTPSGNVAFEPADTNHTVPGVIMGTVAYMSPEQAEGLPTDARTDIWALGVLLFEMASGKVPFSGPTASHTIVAILEHDPDDLEHLLPELRPIVETALQKDRALRFQSAQEMLVALDDVKRRLGYVSDKNISGTATTKHQILTAPRKPYRKLSWLVPAAGAVILIGSVGIFAFFFWFMSRSVQIDGQNGPAANFAAPSPESTVGATAVSDDPGSSLDRSTVNVEPTPEIEQVVSDIKAGKPSETRKPAADQPIRTTKPVAVKKPAVKQQKPAQDPNCVFTNSCS